MILFGVNFNIYFLILTRRWKQALRIEELRVYLGVIAASALLIARAVLAVLLPMAAAQSGLWSPILRALAAWGALLMGQAVCLALLPCLRPTRLQTVVSIAVILALAGPWR